MTGSDRSRSNNRGRQRHQPFHGVASLDEDVATIDAAMRPFTGGRAGVSGPGGR